MSNVVDRSDELAVVSPAQLSHPSYCSDVKTALNNMKDVIAGLQATLQVQLGWILSSLQHHQQLLIQVRDTFCPVEQIRQRWSGHAYLKHRPRMWAYSGVPALSKLADTTELTPACEYIPTLELLRDVLWNDSPDGRAVVCPA